MVERFPKVRIILDHLARPVMEDGPPYASAASLFALAKYPTICLKLTPRSCVESRKGKATPETFFPKLVATFGASRIAWGSNYPSSEGSLSELLALAKDSLTSLSQDDQSWIFAKTAQSLYPALSK
jgi:predicted TIM-barrel fold metal-dependent hydrolase